MSHILGKLPFIYSWKRGAFNLDTDKDIFIELLYKQWYNMLKAYCFSLIGRNSQYAADIDDCILDAFYTAYLKADYLITYESIDKWLRQACFYRMHTNIRKIRHNNNVNVCSISALSPDSLFLSYDPLRQYLDNEDMKCKFHIILCQFSSKDKDLIYDYWYYKMPIAEIAKRRNTTPGTIRNRLNRIRKKAAEAAQETIH